MAKPGGADELGQVVIEEDFETGFVSPANRGGGSNRDMGSLALMLIANWFINGETVLIDGGVSFPSLCVYTYLILTACIVLTCAPFFILVNQAPGESAVQ